MLSRSKTFNTEGIVLKRFNTGETDRIVTLLTRDYGKLVCVAKGARKLKSSKLAHLESGNRIKAFLVKTKGLPLLTQTTLIEDTAETRASLAKIRRLAQILEVFDRLFVEEDTDQPAYLMALKLERLVMKNAKFDLIQKELNKLLQHLGYQDFDLTSHKSILDYVAELSEKKMKSFEFLKVE